MVLGNPNYILNSLGKADSDSQFWQSLGFSYEHEAEDDIRFTWVSKNSGVEFVFTWYKHFELAFCTELVFLLRRWGEQSAFEGILPFGFFATNVVEAAKIGIGKHKNYEVSEPFKLPSIGNRWGKVTEWVHIPKREFYTYSVMTEVTMTYSHYDDQPYRLSFSLEKLKKSLEEESKFRDIALTPFKGSKFENLLTRV